MKQRNSVPLIIQFADVVSKVSCAVLTEPESSKSTECFLKRFLPLAENAMEFISLEVLAETLLGEGELLLYFLFPLCHFGLEQYLFLVHLNSAEGRGSCNMAYLHHAVSSWQLTCLSENRIGPLRM